jgi:hypothetical protein
MGYSDIGFSIMEFLLEIKRFNRLRSGASQPAGADFTILLTKRLLGNCYRNTLFYI